MYSIKNITKSRSYRKELISEKPAKKFNVNNTKQYITYMYYV